MNLLDFIFPKKCIGCTKVGVYFCDACIQTITQEALKCPICGNTSRTGITHTLCKDRFSLDGLWTFAKNEGVIKGSVQKLKNRGITDIGIELVSLMIHYWIISSPFLLDEIKLNKGVGWLLVPTPLAKSKERSKGFNQSAFLGRQIAIKLGLEYKEILKVDYKDLVAISVNSDLASKKVILVTDLWGNGKVAKECCYLLKKSGVEKVWALTLAR